MDQEVDRDSVERVYIRGQERAVTRIDKRLNYSRPAISVAKIIAKARLAHRDRELRRDERNR